MDQVTQEDRCADKMRDNRWMQKVVERDKTCNDRKHKQKSSEWKTTGERRTGLRVERKICEDRGEKGRKRREVERRRG